MNQIKVNIKSNFQWLHQNEMVKSSQHTTANVSNLNSNEFIFNLRKHENASLSSKVDYDSSTEGNVSNREQFKVCYIVKLPKFHLKMASSKMTIFIRTLINIPKFTKPLIMDILVVIIWNCGTFVG